MAQRMQITYTTLSATDPQLHAEMDAAIERVRALRGSRFPLVIDGQTVEPAEYFPVYSPIDLREPLVYFPLATKDDSKRAIAAAQKAFPGWRATPWEERCEYLDRVADRIDDKIFDLSAMMILEMGKNRLEALGEVAETSALLRYYAAQMRENDGYVRPMASFGKTDTNISLLKPYGVWTVIAPFNFPLALAAAPVAAAVVTGNTTILKPSSDAPWTTWEVSMMYLAEELPPGVVNFITGKGSVCGAELVENPAVQGITFTGSYDVGFNQVYRNFATTYPKPVIVEMGGKNPTIISENADLEKAALGVMRSAFGLGGQKCSACSRVYVHEDVYDDFMARLLEKTRAIKIGDPTDQDTWLGPLANKGGFEDFMRFVEKARADGSVVYGGEHLTEGELQHGLYVRPAIITDLPHEHDLVQKELFVPILYVDKVKSLDEAMTKANGVEYGLTAGFFSEDEGEVQWFLENIEAGVVYANRPGGATTGAWPGYQTFGGWKGSGSSGRNIGGLYTLFNYLREQSQTVIREGVG